MIPTTIKKGADDYKLFEAAAKMMEAFSPNGYRYEVEDVYFDLRQGLMQTTIVRKGILECQVLSPSEWEDLLMCTTAKELGACVERIRNGKWFGDK